MAPPSRVCVLLLLVVVGAPCGRALGDRSSAGNYSEGSQYHKNLYRLLQTITSSAAKNGGYSDGVLGLGADKIFALLMCYADPDPSVPACQDCRTYPCQDCLTSPESIMEDCPHSRTAHIKMGCSVIRYSDKSFFSVANLSTVTAQQETSYSWSQQPLAPYSKASTNRTRFELMRRLTAMASQEPMRIARGIQKYDEKDPLVAMVGVAQCTRDLPPSECMRCLSYYTDQLPQLLPNNSVGGSVTGYSCYLWYNTYNIPDTTGTSYDADGYNRQRSMENRQHTTTPTVTVGTEPSAYLASAQLHARRRSIDRQRSILCRQYMPPVGVTWPSAHEVNGT